MLSIQIYLLAWEKYHHANFGHVKNNMQENIDSKLVKARRGIDRIDKPSAKEFILSIRREPQKNKQAIEIKKSSVIAFDQQR